MKFNRHSTSEVSLDVTPLIDVVFLLLIFFMVSTSFTRESHLKIDLPEASGEATKDEKKVLEVVINERGDYTINERPLVNNQADTLKQAISLLAEGDLSMPYIITADAKTPHEFVVRAMDVAGQLGFVRLSITTRRGQSEAK